MILRFKLYSVAGATAFLSTRSDAFTPATVRRKPLAARAGARSVASITRTTATTTTARPAAPSLDHDWDNKDFLSSLGGGEEQVEEANDKYWKEAEARAAMQDHRFQQFQNQNEGGPSPEFYKKMGLSEPPPTGQPQQLQPPPLPPPQQMPPPPPPQPQQPAMQQPPPPQPPQQQMQPPPPPPQQFFDANGNPVALPMVYDANGNLVPFNVPPPLPPSQYQPPAPTQLPPPLAIVEPPLPPTTMGTGAPKPVGRNADAYTMANTADVYFAQLKQDTKVRKRARMSGDVATANQVFADESVHQIKDGWNENPYTKEQNIADARAQIEGTVRMHTIDTNVGANVPSGPSYREKLALAKAKRGGDGGSGAVGPAAAPVPPRVELQSPVAASAPPGVEQRPAGTTTPPPMIEQLKVDLPPPAAVVPSPPPVAPAVQVAPPPPAAPAAVASPPVTAAPVAVAGDDPLRGQVRTLQGLLLKHRGGPGFGAGRLKAPEAQRLDETLAAVMGTLRQETGVVDVRTVPPTAAPPAPAPPVAAQPVAAAVAAPPPKAVAAPVSPLPPTTTAADPLAASLARVEAALRTYKDSAPAAREKTVMSLSEALMFAIGASNKHIAEGELRAHRAALEAGPAAVAPPAAGAPQPLMGFPTTYAVARPEAEGEAAAATSAVATQVPTPVDEQLENEKKLEEVYNTLVQAAGEGGKFGLKNISAGEADNLADKLVTMRTILLDELNDGI